MPSTLRTSIALITRISKGLVEIRFRNEATISMQAIQEIYTKLDHHGWSAPAMMIIIFPDHPVDFDLPVISTDHVQGRPNAADPGRAMALVTANATNERFLQLHLTHFPIPFVTRIFRSEGEARAWLDAGAPN